MPPPPVDAAPRKLDVPDETQVADAEKQIKGEVFGAEFARKKPAELQALAARLIDEAGKTNDNPAAKYVLLREAVDLATRTGDLLLAMRGVDELERHFKVNGVEQRMSVLTGASRGQVPPATLRLVAETALAMVDDLVDADNYSAALALLNVAAESARRASSTSLQNRAKAVQQDVAELTRAFESASAANAALQKNPNDGDANLEAGRFVAFLKGNWGPGLPLLARSSNPRISETATRDLAAPVAHAEQLAIGDAWWELAQTERGPARTQILVRAKYWYDQAVPALTGFTRTKAEKRLTAIDLATSQEGGAERSAQVAVKDAFDYQVSMGRTFYLQGNYARAVAAFTEALRSRPGDARVTGYLQQVKYVQHMVSGNGFANAGFLDEAAREFEAALAQKPNDPAAGAALASASQPPPGPGRGKGKGSK